MYCGFRNTSCYPRIRAIWWLLGLSKGLILWFKTAQTNMVAWSLGYRFQICGHILLQGCLRTVVASKATKWAQNKQYAHGYVCNRGHRFQICGQIWSPRLFGGCSGLQGCQKRPKPCKQYAHKYVDNTGCPTISVTFDATLFSYICWWIRLPICVLNKRYGWLDCF